MSAWPKPLARLAIAVAAGLGAGVLIAVAVAIADLYLSGHGYPSITREWITNDAWGVHMSAGDVMLLAGALIAGVITWKTVK